MLFPNLFDHWIFFSRSVSIGLARIPLQAGCHKHLLWPEPPFWGRGTRQCFPPENALVSCSLFLSWVNCATWSQLLGPGINSWAKVYSIRRWQDKGQIKDPPRSLLQGTFGCEMQEECQSPRCELLLLLLCQYNSESLFSYLWGHLYIQLINWNTSSWQPETT